MTKKSFKRERKKVLFTMLVKDLQLFDREKRSPPRVLPLKISEIFLDSFSTEHLGTAAAIC